MNLSNVFSDYARPALFNDASCCCLLFLLSFCVISFSFTFWCCTLLPVSKTITIRGVRLHYLAWGSPAQPPLVLLHGGSAHAHWWDHIAAALVEEYRVIALDSAVQIPGL